MKTRVLAALAALFVVSGCETFTEPVFLERTDLINEDGVYIYSDLEESMFGDRYWQFSASNSNSVPVCVSVGFGPNSFADIYSLGGSYRVEPGQVIDIGYVNAPADFSTDARAWNTDDYGNC